MDPEQPTIAVEGVTRRFGDVVAVDNLSISLRRGEFLSLLGPSGCGKTTLLRIVAGLETADSGIVRINGSDATVLPAHRRPVNTVFQSYALFPHLDAYENVAFGLRMKRVPPTEIALRVRASLRLVDIESLGSRRPDQLSGGQKQRVALARAIVNEPEVLLLDEPLAALDLRLRRQLQDELRSLQRRLGITFLYVTHDQEEALALSDRIAVMRAGRIEQLGDARSVYERPRTRFASQFLGECSLIEARPAPGVVSAVDTSLGRLVLDVPIPDRSPLTLAIRPEKVTVTTTSLQATAPAAVNAVHMVVDRVSFAGATTHLQLRQGSQGLHARQINAHERGTMPVPGSDVWAILPPNALILLDD